MLVKSASDVSIDTFSAFSFLAFTCFIIWRFRDRQCVSQLEFCDFRSIWCFSQRCRPLRNEEPTNNDPPTDASTTLYQRLNAFRTTAGFSLDLLFFLSHSPVLPFFLKFRFSRLCVCHTSRFDSPFHPFTSRSCFIDNTRPWGYRLIF